MAQLSDGECPGRVCNDAVEPGTKRKCADFVARIYRHAFSGFPTPVILYLRNVEVKKGPLAPVYRFGCELLLL